MTTVCCPRDTGDGCSGCSGPLPSVFSSFEELASPRLPSLENVLWGTGGFGNRVSLGAVSLDFLVSRGSLEAKVCFWGLEFTVGGALATAGVWFWLQLSVEGINPYIRTWIVKVQHCSSPIIRRKWNCLTSSVSWDTPPLRSDSFKLSSHNQSQMARSISMTLWAGM
jgi:hypothetical protein